MWEEKHSCRICGGGLSMILDLGMIYPSEFVDSSEKKVKVPLTLTRCNKCNLVQLKHTVNQDKLYRQYWYQSGLNKSMIYSLRNVAASIEKRIVLRPLDVVVDIGCNDGTLFDLYVDRDKILKIGFDPAKNLSGLAKEKCDVFINDYFTSKSYRSAKARVVTTIAMFYDLDDPHTFIEDVKSILLPDGLWVIQMTDLVSMLKINAFDNICHEHLEYYSLDVLINLLYSHGFEIFDVEYNKVNGGSIRLYVAPSPCTFKRQNILSALVEENKYVDSFDDPFVAFSDRIKNIRKTLINFIKVELVEDKNFAVMGASTKGNTLLQYFGIDGSMISHAAEINPDKFDKKTIGTNIPIIPERESLKLKPDYYLVLPWHFIQNFIEKNKKYLDAGGKFIVPMPEPACIERIGGKIKWTYLGKV